MTRLVIADSGPLFSLAAGNLLHILTNFRLGITDIVKQETIDRGLLPQCSIEARRLHDFYNQNAAAIEVFPTQVGVHLAGLRMLDPSYPTPRNLGELSIQSLLIELQLDPTEKAPLILFEDGWFLRNSAGLAKPCALINTRGFLMNAEIHGLIPSAAQALIDIAAGNRVPSATIIHQEFPKVP
ncbi:MAG: hypothetical protein M3R60_10125 [Pseudomonadota bacterium]|nr:hypothetical protein [Pseudomonadota bacterium]